MTKRFAVAAVIFVCAFALGAEEVLYQIDLIPSGKATPTDLPTPKGGSYLYHQFPAGTLISVKKSTVKKISKMTPEAIAQVDPKQQLTSIRDLPDAGPETVPRRPDEQHGPRAGRGLGRECGHLGSTRVAR